VVRDLKEVMQGTCKLQKVLSPFAKVYKAGKPIKEVKR